MLAHINQFKNRLGQYKFHVYHGSTYIETVLRRPCEHGDQEIRIFGRVYIRYQNKIYRVRTTRSGVFFINTIFPIDIRYTQVK